MVEIVKKKNKTSPEETILRVLNNSIKSFFHSERQEDALITMLKSLSLFFRDVGVPPQWLAKKKGDHKIDVRYMKKKASHKIPKNTRKFIDALSNISEKTQSPEISFWICVVMGGIDTRLDGKLTHYLIDSNQQPWIIKLFENASKNIENALFLGDVDSVKRVVRFCKNTNVSCMTYITNELNRIRKRSLDRLPEISRSFLMSDQISGPSPVSTRISDPSQSVEVHQLAYLLRSAWMRRQQDNIDVEIFDSLAAFCKGFKNLELLGSMGERTKFSDELFSDERFSTGEDVIIKVPPVIWKSGARQRVIIKGTADII
jgi:hypothetical protein